MDQIDSNFRIF